MYEAVKIVHILAWTSWMAGLFYLPRLFVYHAERAKEAGETSAVFKVMEQKLLRLIMTPAMIATWITGLWLAVMVGWPSVGGWIWLKLGLVAAMTGLHHMMERWRRDFAADRNLRSGRFYRIANEAPTLVFVGIVVVAILKPF